MGDRKYKDPYREYTDATDVGADKLLLSAEQQAGIDQAKADWQKYSEAGDQAGMNEAHRRAEAIRAQAGYSGGANGGAYNRFADDGGSGVHMSSTHTASPKWTPTYSRERADTLSQIQSRSPFSYDPEKDPTYQQYKAQYERGAQKAMEDTMGQVMARTGGLASSFAQTAGQQAYGSYMAQLADKVPELRQLAYQMYMDEGDRLRSDLQMYDSLDSSDAARWQSTVLSPFQADRAYAKEMDDTLYSRGRDALADQRYEREYADQREDVAYERAQAAKQQAIADAINQYQYSGDVAGMQGLGWDVQNALKRIALEMQEGELGLQQQKAQIAATNRSNRGSVSDKKVDDKGAVDWLNTIMNMSEGQAKAALMGAGLPQWQVTEYMDLWKKAQIAPGTALSGKAVTWENELKEIEDKWGEKPNILADKVLDLVEKAQGQGLSDDQARRILARYGIGG